MRERSLRVNRHKLNDLNNIYRPGYIARTLGVSKQRWCNYRNGVTDMPESILDSLCDRFALQKAELIEASPN